MPSMKDYISKARDCANAEPGTRVEISDFNPGILRPMIDNARSYRKNDTGKPPMASLAILPEGPLLEIAEIMEFGAKKYAMNNWQKGGSWMRMMSAALRHIFAWLRGDDKDPETGKSHLAHAACCIIFAMWYQKNSVGQDDRYAELSSQSRTSTQIDALAGGGTPEPDVGDAGDGSLLGADHATGRTESRA